jgi:sortase B
MKNRKAAKVLYWLTVSVLILIVVGCAAIIGVKLVTDAANKKQYDELSAIKDAVEATRPPIEITEPATTLTEPEETLPEQTDPPAPTAPPNIDDTIILQYQALYEMNRDMVGWLEIENTAIDYPVVQTPKSPNFYLRRNFYKEDATCGTIYAREACDINLPSDNVVLYGHNMRNGTMFADLMDYKSKSFWEDHKYVHFDTLHEFRTYEVFAVFQTTADLTKGFTYHIFDTFNTEADFNSYVSTCKNLSRKYYDTGITPVYGDKLLTLSTCDKSIEDGRFVVMCRRIA